MRREDYRASLTMMAGLGAATLTGFLREAVLAHQLGAGRATDVYLIAFTVPEFLFVALPIVLSPAFIPLFADLRLKAGEAAAWRLAGRVAGALLALLLAVTAVIALSTPLYLRWLAPGFDPAEQAETRQAVYLMLPAVCLMGAGTLAGLVLQVYRRFARPALATAVYNLVFIALLLALPLAWSAGRAAVGVTVGAAAAFVIQASLAWRTRPAGAIGLPGTGSEGNNGETTAGHGTWDVARLAGPLAVGYAVHHIIYFVDRAMATTVGVGGVATLNYAYRLALVVGQLSGLAVSTALFPRMAEQAASDDRPGLRASLAAALRFVWKVGLPATVGLIVLREPLVQMLFERGAFDRAATVAVSGPLAGYAVAVLADALCQPLWRVLYARRQAWTVLAVNGLQTTIRVLINFALIRSLGYNGLALSAALGLMLQVLVLGRLVRGHLGAYLPGKWWRSAAGVLFAAAVAALIAALAAKWTAGWPVLGNLLVSGVCGGLAYLAVLRLVRA